MAQEKKEVVEENNEDISKQHSEYKYLDRIFIENKAKTNIQFAQKIVDEYDWKSVYGRELNDIEKATILSAILSNLLLSKPNILKKLLKSIEDAGYNQKDSYTIVLNSAINGKFCKQENAYYTHLLSGMLSIKNIDPGDIYKTLDGKKTLIMAKEKYIKSNPQIRENFLQSLKNIGLEEEILKQVDVRNIYIANDIVKQFDWEKGIGRKLEANEQVEILTHMLNNTASKRNLTISRFLQKLLDLGFEQQEANAIIINIANDGGFLLKNTETNTRMQYTKLLIGSSNIPSKENVPEELTKITPERFVELVSSEKNKIKVKYSDVIPDKEKISKIRYKNILSAENILEGIDWKKEVGRDLKEEEKKDIISILVKNKNTERGYGNYFDKMQKSIVSKGATEEEARKIIINKALYSHSRVPAQSTYANLMKNDNSKLDAETIKEISTFNPIIFFYKIRENAVSVNKEKSKKVLEEVEKIGVKPEIIKGKNIKNIFTAKEIVEKYDWEKESGRKLEQNEKARVLTRLIKNGRLKNKTGVNITLLMEKLQKKGLAENEILAFIINSAFGKNIDKNIVYGSLLGGNVKIDELNIPEKYKKVDLSILEENHLRREYTAYSKIKKEDIVFPKVDCRAIKLLPKMDYSSLKTANSIIERYDWKNHVGRDITEDEKIRLLFLFGKPTLNQEVYSRRRKYKNDNYLIKLTEELHKKNLPEEEIDGFLIKLAIRGKLSSQNGYGVTKLYNNPEIIKEAQLEPCDFEITENVLETAMNKTKCLMKKSVATLRKDGQLEEIDEIISNLNELAKTSKLGPQMHVQNSAKSPTTVILKDIENR